MQPKILKSTETVWFSNKLIFLLCSLRKIYLKVKEVKNPLFNTMFHQN